MITIIDGKRYTVTHVFNMVGNFHFTDKTGAVYLVDGEDVGAWAEENNKKHEGIKTAIEYAKAMAAENEGVFYWKIK